MKSYPFYYQFFFTETLNLSNEKWKLTYLNQYSPRNKNKRLCDKDVHPIQ